MAQFSLYVHNSGLTPNSFPLFTGPTLLTHNTFIFFSSRVTQKDTSAVHKIMVTILVMLRKIKASYRSYN